MGNRFFRGRRIQRKGILLRSDTKLTNSQERFTLINVTSDQKVYTLGIYSSLEEAKEELQNSGVVEGLLHIFTTDNRVLYSEEKGGIDAK